MPKPPKEEDMTIYSTRVDADPTKIKTWIDAQAGSNLIAVSIVIQGTTAIIVIDKT